MEQLIIPDPELTKRARKVCITDEYAKLTYDKLTDDTIELLDCGSALYKIRSNSIWLYPISSNRITTINGIAIAILPVFNGYIYVSESGKSHFSPTKSYEDAINVL